MSEAADRSYLNPRLATVAMLDLGDFPESLPRLQQSAVRSGSLVPISKGVTLTLPFTQQSASCWCAEDLLKIINTDYYTVSPFFGLFHSIPPMSSRSRWRRPCIGTRARSASMLHDDLAEAFKRSFSWYWLAGI